MPTSVCRTTRTRTDCADESRGAGGIPRRNKAAQDQPAFYRRQSAKQERARIRLQLRDAATELVNPLDNRLDLSPLDARRRRKQSGEGSGGGGTPKPKRQKFLGLPGLTKASRLRLFLQHVARRLTGHAVQWRFGPAHSALTNGRAARYAAQYHAANQRDGPDRGLSATERRTTARNIQS